MPSKGSKQQAKRTLELFCGTKSFSKVAERLGHSTFTVDNDPQHEPDLVADMMRIAPSMLPRVDILWASPPCTAFSVAAIGHHWTGGHRAYIPKTEAAQLGISLVKKTLDLIEKTRPKYWFIENPRGVLRKLPMMGGVRRVS